MNKKIGVLLPFKDQFIKSKAGSASIWIKDFNKNSRYKKQILIFGNTDNSKDLISKKNYINLSVKTLSIGGKNTFYVNEFLKHFKKNNFGLIEIHNRPYYIHQILKNKINVKLVLIFHNNPLNLGGSETLGERQILLNRCEKIIFVSNWEKKNFFKNSKKKTIQNVK